MADLACADQISCGSPLQLLALVDHRAIAAMPGQPLPAELQEFLAKHIDSIAQLEALLLLREGSDVVWDVQTTAKRLYIGEQEAEEVVGLLAGHGFIVFEESGYRYRPQSQELARMVDVLADTTAAI